MDERKLDPRLLSALAVSAVLVVAFGLATCGGADTSSPTAAVESYFAAVADGDAEEACSVGTEEFQRNAVASVVGTPSEGETCEQAVANVPGDAREVIEDVRVETISTAGDVAVVEVTLESHDFPPDPIRFRAERGEDGWLVAGLADETPRS